MKKIYTFSTLLVFLCGMLMQAQIITNGSFENGINSSWSHSFSSGQASFNTETIEVRDGSQGLRVEVTQTGSGQEDIKSVNSTFSNTSKEIYLVRFWAKASADADLYVSVAGNSTDKVHYKIRPHWKLYHLPFDSSASAITLNFFYQNQATYYIDGVEILDQESGVIDVEQTFKWNEKYTSGFGWTAGDNDISLELPDGRIAYFFNDSFYGYNDVTDNEFDNSGAKFLRNAMVVEEADGLLHSRYSGDQSTTDRYFESIEASPDPNVDNFYWVGDAIMDQGKVLVYLVELLNNSGGATETGRTYIAQFSYPELELENIKKQEDFTAAYESFFKDGNYLYLYRTETADGGWSRLTHVARCAQGDLLGRKGTWEFYDGSNWVSDRSQSQIVNNVGAEGFVKLQEGNYAQISLPVLGRDLQVSFAENPEGPWTQAQTVYTIPNDEEYWWYLPNIHHQLPNGKFQISYSVNSWEGWADAWKDKYWYRQRYIQLDLLGLSPYTTNNSQDNLALNQPTTTSSTYGSNTGNLAVDGDTQTRWESNYSDLQWLSVDLGDAYEINQIKITWETAMAANYEIQTSHDGSTWATVKTIEGNYSEINNHAALANVARYVRIYGTQRATMWGHSIKELEVYGTPVQSIDITDLGGNISAEYNDSPITEGISNIIDNSSSTKFLTFHGSAYVDYEGISNYIVNSYTITSANDAPERDPLSWNFQGSHDGTNWVTIDSRSNEDFASRFQKRTFSFDNDKSYQFYRFDMNNNSGSILQVAEVEIFGFDAPVIENGMANRETLVTEVVSTEDNLKPYPLPFSTTLFVPLGNSLGEKEITLYDITGKKLFVKTIEGEGYYQLNASSISNTLASGIYLLRIKSENTFKTYKVLKQ